MRCLVCSVKSIAWKTRRFFLHCCHFSSVHHSQLIVSFAKGYQSVNMDFLMIKEVTQVMLVPWVKYIGINQAFDSSMTVTLTFFALEIKDSKEMEFFRAFAHCIECILSKTIRNKASRWTCTCPVSKLDQLWEEHYALCAQHLNL